MLYWYHAKGYIVNVDRTEALRRLKSPNNLANRLNGGVASGVTPAAPVGPVPVSDSPHSTVVNKPARESTSLGRGVEVPEGQRDLIARAALLGLATQKVIGEHFGVPQKTVSMYERGIVTPGKDGSDRQDAHKQRVLEVRDLALEKTMAALGLIDGAKLENLEAKDLGRFAKDMAGVYNSLTPKDGIGNTVPLQLHVYAPQVNEESRYKIVDV